MNTVFVTGASGKIGKVLTRQLLEKGYYVVVLVRDKLKFPLEDKNLRIVEADILEIDKYQKEIRNCDFVYHLAVYQRTQLIPK
ncbi:NAD(P)H-binding protein [Patescibacteria group bacterium]|nr:NAD(P)H-binding protein [Patescibacteria group bacterium]